MPVFSLVVKNLGIDAAREAAKREAAAREDARRLEQERHDQERRDQERRERDEARREAERRNYARSRSPAGRVNRAGVAATRLRAKSEQAKTLLLEGTGARSKKGLISVLTRPQRVSTLPLVFFFLLPFHPPIEGLITECGR